MAQQLNIFVVYMIHQYNDMFIVYIICDRLFIKRYNDSICFCYSVHFNNLHFTVSLNTRRIPTLTMAKKNQKEPKNDQVRKYNKLSTILILYQQKLCT